MKKKKEDFKDKSIQELIVLADELSMDLSKLKFRHSMRQLEKTADLKKIRKQIAQVNTIRREKEIAKESAK